MKDVIELSVDLKASAGWIWNALTDKDELSNWWGEKIVLEPKKGGVFKEPWEDDEGNRQVASGQVLEVKKEQFIRFTWQEKNWPKNAITECSFSIEDAGTKRILTLTHSGWDSFPKEKKAGIMKDFKTGWGYHLKELKSYLDD